MKRSSSLDCQSIGQSLKRVKISTSPGELRVDRDIENLILGKQWTSTAAQASPAGPIDERRPSPSRYGGGAGSSSPVPPSWDWRCGGGGRVHVELFRHDARLVRDPVDPLRLRLEYLHQPTTSPNNNSARPSSPLPQERWTFCIRMPRMYPHVPPLVKRVTRDFAPNNENMAHLGNANVGYGASAAIVANSAMQSRVEPPVPEHVLINPLPPTPNSGFHTGNDRHGFKLSDIDLATSVFNAWSPVSSLQDLIDFLVGIPARRRQWWAAESNRKRHHQQRRVFGHHVGGVATPMGQPTFAPASTFRHQHDQTFHQPKQQQQFASSHCDMEHDGDANVVESMMEDARHDFLGAVSTEKHANPFTENRFDVGYPKPRRQWDVR